MNLGDLIRLKTLGSLVCSEKDIKHRCILGNVAFRKFENIWLKKTKISLSRKLMIYEAQVVSIIMNVFINGRTKYPLFVSRT